MAFKGRCSLFFVFFVQEIVVVFHGAVLKSVLHCVLECFSNTCLRNECTAGKLKAAFFAFPNACSDSLDSRKIAFCAGVRTSRAAFEVCDELSVFSAVSDTKSACRSGNFTFACVFLHHNVSPGFKRCLAFIIEIKL